jgi:hypothetical protein
MASFPIVHSLVHQPISFFSKTNTNYALCSLPSVEPLLFKILKIPKILWPKFFHVSICLFIIFLIAPFTVLVYSFFGFCLEKIVHFFVGKTALKIQNSNVVSSRKSQ